MASKMVNLHEGEETIRTESLKRIDATPDWAAHLSMIESCMDLIFELLPSTDMKDADQLTYGNLGIRMFNALASSVKLLLSGYYQAAALQLRDVMETAFLLNYFSTCDELIRQWRTMLEKDRKKEFSPFRVRTALDDRDGFKERKRAKAYDLLCNLAAHATPEGFIMLVPDRTKTNVHCGPFLENTALEAVLSEAAKLALQAAQAFRTVMKNERPEQKQVRKDFMRSETKWLIKFYGDVIRTTASETLTTDPKS